VRIEESRTFHDPANRSYGLIDAVEKHKRKQKVTDEKPMPDQMTNQTSHRSDLGRGERDVVEKPFRLQMFPLTQQID
jgi:hypothetical protein